MSSLPQTLITILIGLLHSDDLPTRDFAGAALRRLGDAAVPALLRAWRSPDSEVRARAKELLLEAGSRVPASSLALSLILDSAGPEWTGRVRIRNAGRLPVTVCLRCLHADDSRKREVHIRISHPAQEPPATEFLRIDPGETAELAVAGRVVGRRLVPWYRHDPKSCREEFRPRAVQGESSGAAVTFRPIPGFVIRVLELRNAEAGETARILDQILDGTVEIASDARTNTLIVRADPGSLEIVEDVVAQLDRDPP